MISAGSVLEGAFGLIRDHPAAVAVWGLIYLAAVAGTSLAIQPLLAGATDPEAIAANMESMFGQLMLFQFGFFILFVAMWTAAQRAILRPSQEGIAFIRFGMDEVRMLILMIVLGIIFYVGLLIAIVAITLVAVAGYAAGGAVVAVPIAAIGAVLSFGIVIWLQVRLSLAFPLTLLREEIVIGESWRLTKGRFWPLFGAYLVIFMLIFALSIAASFATTGSYLIEIIQNMKDPVALQRVMEAQMAR
ncbi:MAG: hypothetical protein ACXW2T_01825, partial [Allosphingosinicella sp.]